MTSLEMALGYLNYGWSVIPIATGEKTPLIKSWLEFQKRQPSKTEVTKWFTDWPEANVAVIVGKISGLVVIDIDDPLEGGESFRKYFGEPQTLAVKTPKGSHYYFKHPGDRTIANAVRAAPGLDVKADGGYVLAPPSVVGGLRYKWVKGTLIDLPSQTLLATSVKQPVDLADAGDILEGGRNNLLTRIAGKLLVSGLTQAECLVQCLALNATRCKPPLPETEVKAIVASIAAREAQKAPVKPGLFKVESFDKTQEEQVEWLWPGVLPKGKLTLFIGDPGHGKSLLSVEIAACISAGKQFPDGTKPQKENVLMVFCEDGAGDTVKPRLRTAGADVTKVMNLTVDGRFLKLDTDLTQLDEVIKQNNVTLLTIDPLSAYLGNINSWKDDEVRRLLAGVGDLADRTKCSILCIMHLNKKVSSNAIDRGMGSVAFTAVARSVFLIGEHPEADDPRKILAPVKANLVEQSKALVFKINSSSEKIPYIEWDGETTYTTRDILQKGVSGLDNDSRLEQAILFIENQLRTGEKSIKLIFDLAKREGLPEKTIEKAKQQLGVKSNQQNGTWYWKLPYAPPHSGGDLPF